jgi:hypothetical protein
MVRSSVRWLLALSTILAAAAVVAAGANASPGTSSPCSSGTVVHAGPYVFALSIGPAEAMYTPAQAKAKHPQSGEVVLSGATSGTGIPSSASRHLVVHICTSGGAVVAGALPTIVVSDPKAKPTTTTVPVVTMQGVGTGASDYHYGNNVTLVAGDHVTVTVAVHGRRAVFHVVVPKTTTGG